MPGRRVGEKLDHRHAGRRLVQDRVDLAGIGAGEAEIGEQHDHRATMPPPSSPRQGTSQAPWRFLQILGGLRIVAAPLGSFSIGGDHEKVVLLAALVAALALQPAWAANKAASSCYSPSAAEAEQALRYMTDLMIVSSAVPGHCLCRFRLRNRDAIVGYQKALIAHFHGTAAFDRWNTALANQAAQQQSGMTPPALRSNRWRC